MLQCMSSSSILTPDSVPSQRYLRLPCLLNMQASFCFSMPGLAKKELVASLARQASLDMVSSTTGSRRRGREKARKSGDKKHCLEASPKTAPKKSAEQWSKHSNKKLHTLMPYRCSIRLGPSVLRLVGPVGFFLFVSPHSSHSDFLTAACKE
jgi:hypothetical protein